MEHAHEYYRPDQSLRFNVTLPCTKKGFAMTTSQSIALVAMVGFGLTFAPAALATSVGETCAALAEARTSLYSMLYAKDKSAQDALKAKMQAASNRVDSALASMTGADAKVTADFKVIWNQFTATRDNEIIPAIYKGNIEDARKIADGIQMRRFSRMWSIMACSR